MTLTPPPSNTNRGEESIHNLNNLTVHCSNKLQPGWASDSVRITYAEGQNVLELRKLVQAQVTRHPHKTLGQIYAIDESMPARRGGPSLPPIRDDVLISTLEGKRVTYVYEFEGHNIV